MINHPNTTNPGGLPWQRPVTEHSTRLVTIDEVAEYLNISKWLVYNQINNKKLKTITIGSRRFVHPADLQAYVEGLRAEAGGFHE